MTINLQDWFDAQKFLSRRPDWVRQDMENLRLVCPLEIDSVTVAGLEFCAYATSSLPDEAVRFQLQFLPPRGKSKPLARFDWRPLASHTNSEKAPSELKSLVIHGSHLHPFEYNFNAETNDMRKGNLPVAQPLSFEPSSFDGALASVAAIFKIGNINLVPLPPWQKRVL